MRKNKDYWAEVINDLTAIDFYSLTLAIDEKVKEIQKQMEGMK